MTFGKPVLQSQRQVEENLQAALENGPPPQTEQGDDRKKNGTVSPATSQCKDKREIEGTVIQFLLQTNKKCGIHHGEAQCNRLAVCANNCQNATVSA